jgi:transcriptional regulator with XRE-family HTH domain
MLLVHFNGSKTVSISSVGELVRAARKGRNQKEFAQLLGVRQSSVSRYESGKASPPISVIEHCMRLVHTDAQDRSPSAEQLANRVRETMAGPGLEHVRSAMSRLVDVFASEHIQIRTTGVVPQ